MNTSTYKQLLDRAKEFGKASARAYREEFGYWPCHDGVFGVGDWDSAAWCGDWLDLMAKHGAALIDHDLLRALWNEGFWRESE